MANRIVEKWHLPQTLGYDGSPQEISLFPGGNLTAGNTRNTPQGFVTLPIACKIPLVGVAFSTANPQLTSFNIVIGGGAPLATGVLTPDDSDVRFPPTVNNAQGMGLFFDPVNGGTLDQPVSGIVTPYSGIVFPTTEPDAIFPQGLNFTFRYTGTTATVGTARVTLFCIPVNIRSFSGIVPWTWGNSNVG